MSTNSSIEWTESTWNPLTGCTKISSQRDPYGPGCKHCYAERMALRLKAMGQPNYVNGFKSQRDPNGLTLHEDAGDTPLRTDPFGTYGLELPLHWKKPQTIFVNSMSDMFHESVPVEFIQRAFGVMQRAHPKGIRTDWHRFQILTKRSERLLELSPALTWADNIWMGVSVENQDYAFRIEHVRETGAKIKFLSLEPLLGTLPPYGSYDRLKLKGIDWVIVGRTTRMGGESGPGARVMKPEWVVDIRNQCQQMDILFFFKSIRIRTDSGAESRKRNPGASWRGEHGMICQLSKHQGSGDFHSASQQQRVGDKENLAWLGENQSRYRPQPVGSRNQQSRRVWTMGVYRD